MTSATILGPLNAIHELQAQLLEDVPDADAHRQFHPELGSLAWYLGRGVYQELYWLREKITGDDDLSTRVAHLFTPGALPLAEQCAQLPPNDHLLNWAAEIWEAHLVRLANPGGLPPHPLLEADRLPWFLLQEQARHYESMLMVLQLRSLETPTDDYRVREPLRASPPHYATHLIDQGHYRIGARNEPAACDNELPPQAVELAPYRIATRPVTNGDWLAFMEAGGYDDPACWSQEGWAWRQNETGAHPLTWRQDAQGQWYALGINGPADLVADQPVSGINRYEAEAFAKWAASLGGALEGAVLQHEYQWEVAARTGGIEMSGRVWEWCANPFHAYPEFEPWPSMENSQAFFDAGYVSLRGGSLHTQRVRRRTSARHRLRPEQRFGFAGLRLVFPPGEETRW